MKKCKICKKEISKRNKSGHCNSCAQKLIWKKNPHRYDGENNPFFGKKHNKKYIKCLKNRIREKNSNFKDGNRVRLYDKCIICGKKVTISCRSGLCGSCSMKKRWNNDNFIKKVMDNQLRGKNSPNYIHGKGYEPYTIEFTESLKKEIRNRDGNKCIICGMTKKEHYQKYNRNLEVHHIDHNKNNCKKSNLETRCKKCNIADNK
jgi:hypothetical protein